MTFLPNHNEFLTFHFCADFDFIKVRRHQKRRAQMSSLSQIEA